MKVTSPKHELARRTIRHLGMALALLVSIGIAGVRAQATWQLLRPSNTGIPGEEVRFARFAADGKLWVAARWIFWQEGGLGVYDRSTQVWTDYVDFETPLPSEYLTDMAFASDGSVWVGTDKGLVHKNGDTWKVYDTSNSPLLHNEIQDVEIAPNGHVWVNNTMPSSGNAAIFEFDGVSTWRRYKVGSELPFAPPWYQLSDVMVDHLGHVWVASEVLNGVAEYDGSRWVLHGANVDRFGSLMEDPSGNIWAIAGVGGYNAFYKFDRSSWSSYGSTNTPFVNTTITTMAIDQGGALLVGNWYGQIIRSTDAGQTWSLFTLQNDRIMSIAPDPASTDVYVCTSGAVRQLDANGTWLRAFNTYNTGMPWFFVDNMYADRQGNFWLATGEAGASRFDGKRWRNWGAHNAGSEPWPFGAEQAYGLYEDDQGAMWIGSNGIGRLDPTGALQIWDVNNTPGFEPSIFEWFAPDRNRTLFAVNDNAGVYRFDAAQAIWSREALSLYAPWGSPGMEADTQGNVWVAGWFDLHRWDGASWSTVGTDWPLFDMGGMNAFEIGPRNELWMGTNEGLLHWDGTQLETLDPSNTPMPASHVTGIAFRNDGVMAFAVSDFQSVTPFPNGVCIVRGDIHDPANWDVYSYGGSPLPHYQLDCLEFDGAGRLWVSAVSMGVAIIDLGTPVDVEPDISRTPVRWALYDAAPNPFNPSTHLRYDVPAGGTSMRLDLYDVRGRLVRVLARGAVDAGPHVVTWDGRDDRGRSLPSGVYFARLRANDYRATRKLMLAR